MSHPLNKSELEELQRWNTPTIYNGWEQLTQRNAGKECFNWEETKDFMPEMGPMAGYAVTLVVEPSNQSHTESAAANWEGYLKYLAEGDYPKVVVVQDLDKPKVLGSPWGEVTSNMAKAMGCVGTIVDGAIRDVDEMRSVGFKALARRMCVGHAFSCPVRWGCDVDVFGIRVQPGQLIHADKHGFLAIPEEDQAGLLEASAFLDSCERKTFISTIQNEDRSSKQALVSGWAQSGKDFNALVKSKYENNGEW